MSVKLKGLHILIQLTPQMWRHARPSFRPSDWGTIFHCQPESLFRCTWEESLQLPPQVDCLSSLLPSRLTELTFFHLSSHCRRAPHPTALTDSAATGGPQIHRQCLADSYRHMELWSTSCGRRQLGSRDTELLDKPSCRWSHLRNYRATIPGAPWRQRLLDSSPVHHLTC